MGVGEVFYNRYIVKKDLFKGVMNLLSQHLHRNNLINSAIIELFDHIRVKNVKELINYMVDKYRTLYEKLDYVDTYKNLLVKYEQNQQYEQVPLLTPPHTSKLQRSTTHKQIATHCSIYRCCRASYGDTSRSYLIQVASVQPPSIRVLVYRLVVPQHLCCLCCLLYRLVVPLHLWCLLYTCGASSTLVPPPLHLCHLF